MADRAPATIQAGAISIEGMNFVRHYWLEDGTVGGDNVGANSKKLEINAIRVGSLGFATTPFETFDTNGMEIKDGSPFEITFVLSCANGQDGYVPAKYVWDYPNSATDRPYEEMSCRYYPGTGENVAADLVAMLKELNNG